MKQNETQRFFLYGVTFILGVMILVWLLGQACPKNNEKFSPYRHTGMCPPRTGMNYLDVYEQQDYYKKYPYVYPTPDSYTTKWYSLRRNMNRDLAQRKFAVLEKMEEK